jgi:hypothetical protein
MKKSKKPYILLIKKINNNNKNINLKYTKEYSPLSGSEYDYEPKKWNLNNNIKETHNCYSYAMGKIVPKLKNKAQPGYASGYNHINDENFKCSDFKKRLIQDSPGSYLETFDKPCMPGFYKVFLALDVPNDYHWWRQDSNKYWSHKPGSTEVINLDAVNEKIKNPLTSNRKFTHRNYSTPCFFACVYSDLTRALNSVYNL